MMGSYAQNGGLNTAGEELARNLCNLTLQIEILTHLVDHDATLYFKRLWNPDDSEVVGPAVPYRPTWNTGWYLLRTI